MKMPPKWASVHGSFMGFTVMIKDKSFNAI